MYIKSIHNRTTFYQWDSNQSLSLSSDIADLCSEVHFENDQSDQTYAVEVKDGTVAVPNEILQLGKDFRVWCWVGTEHRTRFSQLFHVIPRPMPPDFIFTPTEQRTWEDVLAASVKARDAAENAATSESNAKISANIASDAMQSATTSATSASESATLAKASEVAARESADAFIASRLTEHFIGSPVFAFNSSEAAPISMSVTCPEGKTRADVGFIHIHGKNRLTDDPEIWPLEQPNPNMYTLKHLCLAHGQTYTFSCNKQMAEIKIAYTGGGAIRALVTDTKVCTYTSGSAQTVDITLTCAEAFDPTAIEAQFEIGARPTAYVRPTGMLYRLSGTDGQVAIPYGESLSRTADGVWYIADAPLEDADQRMLNSIIFPKGSWEMRCESYPSHFEQGVLDIEYIKSMELVMKTNREYMDKLAFKIEAMNHPQSSTRKAVCMASSELPLRWMLLRGKTEGGLNADGIKTATIRGLRKKVYKGDELQDEIYMPFAKPLYMSANDHLKRIGESYVLMRGDHQMRLTGEETIQKAANGAFFVELDSSLFISPVQEIRCDRFKTFVHGALWIGEHEDGLVQYGGYGHLYFTRPDASIVSVEDFRAWLKKNWVTLLWKMPTEMAEELPTGTLYVLNFTRTEKDSTVFEIDDGVFDSVSYYADPEAYVDAKIAMI